MRVVVGVVFCIPLVCSADIPPPRPVGVAAEVKWARGVAEDFWAACRSDHPEQAAGLMSPELARAVQTHDFSLPGDKQVTPGEYLRQRAELVGYGVGAEVRFDAEELAPDRSEVVFRGRVTGVARWVERVTNRFVMRVAKEPGGRWSVRYLLVTREKAEGEADSK
jgi:hypothetical protein